jgi:hypothetical protein
MVGGPGLSFGIFLGTGSCNLKYLGGGLHDLTISGTRSATMQDPGLNIFNKRQ